MRWRTRVGWKSDLTCRLVSVLKATERQAQKQGEQLGILAVVQVRDARIMDKVDPGHNVTLRPKDLLNWLCGVGERQESQMSPSIFA